MVEVEGDGGGSKTQYTARERRDGYETCPSIGCIGTILMKARQCGQSA